MSKIAVFEALAGFYCSAFFLEFKKIQWLTNNIKKWLKSMQKLILFITCFFVASYASGSIKEKKKNSASSVEITVEENYQRVYKKLLEKMHECKSEAWAGESASYRVKNDLRDDRKEGNITFIMSNAGSQVYYIHIKIVSIADTKTKAKAYVYYSTEEDYLPLISQWVFDDNSGCNLRELSNA
jgi:hypothetical protein